MFNRIGHFVVRNRKATLAAYLVFIAIAAGVGTGVFGNMKTQGYDDPQSESTKVDSILRNEFKVRDASMIFLIDLPQAVDTLESQATVSDIVNAVSAEAHVDQVVSYWSAGKPDAMVSSDGKETIVSIYFDKNIDPELASTTAGELQEKYDGTRGNTRIYVAGLETIYHSINSTIQKDLVKAESIAIPLNILMLLIIFGTAVASGLPMVVAVGSIFGSFLSLFAISQFADVSVFALNLITGLGMGLGIDYALLVVNRFREELHAGHDVESSVAKAVSTAGRTVFFSGVAVMAVLASMVLFPQYFLKSFAYAGISVVFFAVVASLFALPAVLALLGKNVDKWTIRKSALTNHDQGGWAKTAHTVMKRPVLFIIAAVGLLSLLALPAKNVKFGQVDERVLPASAPVAVAIEESRNRFEGQAASPVELLIPTQSASSSQLDELAKSFAGKAEVVSVLTPTLFATQGQTQALPRIQAAQIADGYNRISIVLQDPPRQESSVDFVKNLRDMELPEGSLVGGASAIYVDSQAGISNHLTAVLTWLAIAVFVVLFMYTGSILLPLKAVVLNLVSLGATLGLVTYVFQEGNMKWLVGDFTVTGNIDTSSLVLIAVVAFGLSMDYELFMLSRIKEEHDNGADTRDAVSFGLQRSGRIISAAAILIALVFATFVTSGVTSIKMLGLGTAFAILLDATVVRAILVPALMRIAGKWNWWAPAPLAKFHARYGIRD